MSTEKLTFAIRCLGLWIICIGQTSCSVLQYQKGLVFHRANVKSMHVEGTESGIKIHTPPMAIHIGSNPESGYLAAGPLIFPVIPWIPGIVDLVIHKQKYQVSDNKITLHLRFLNHSGWPERVSAHFIFSPDNTVLTVGDRNFEPTSVTWLKGSCTTNNQCHKEIVDCSLENGCKKEVDGRYSIVVSPSPFPYMYPECVLIYDVSMSRIVDADLSIENIVFEGSAMSFKVPIKRRSAIHMRSIGL